MVTQRGHAPDPVWLSPRRRTASSNPVAFGDDLATGFRATQSFDSADSKSRRTDDRLSNNVHDTITGGHRATTTLRSPGRRYSARRRQPHGEGVDITVQKLRHETKKAESCAISMCCRAGRPQRIEIAKFPERHFWHEGYDKAQADDLVSSLPRRRRSRHEIP